MIYQKNQPGFILLPPWNDMALAGIVSQAFFYDSVENLQMQNFNCIQIAAEEAYKTFK